MQEKQVNSLMTDIFSKLVKGRGDKGEKYYKTNCLASVRASKKKRERMEKLTHKKAK